MYKSAIDQLQICKSYETLTPSLPFDGQTKHCNKTIKDVSVVKPETHYDDVNHIKND
jgi:hypothetical protein